MLGCRWRTHLSPPHGEGDDSSRHVHQVDVPLGHLAAVFGGDARQVLHSLDHADHVWKRGDSEVQC